LSAREREGRKGKRKGILRERKEKEKEKKRKRKRKGVCH
jgi:hypothetical protein